MLTSTDNSQKPAAFTLIELVLVMVLLATLLAISAPTLSRSFKGRALEQEAVRLLAATEYAREEAVSQSLPMTLWIDPVGGTFGVRAKGDNPGDPSREETWALPQELRFDLQPAPTDTAGRVIAATFDPEGTLALESLTPLVLVHRTAGRITLVQTDDGWGYEIAPASP
ncbi:MAG: GspH/FimT family pseudopilin [Verrucomicrobiota bacterium]